GGKSGGLTQAWASGQSIYVFDLSTGELMPANPKFLYLYSWRPLSPELIVYTHVNDGRRCSWDAYNVRDGTTRHLFTGGLEAHVSSDGHLMIVRSVYESFVALIDLETAETLDR